MITEYSTLTGSDLTGLATITMRPLAIVTVAKLHNIGDNFIRIASPDLLGFTTLPLAIWGRPPLLNKLV